MKTLESDCRAAAYLNKALQQNRDDVLRYGESIGCDLLKAADYDVVGVSTQFMTFSSPCLPPSWDVRR
jgi:hypothetical protein